MYGLSSDAKTTTPTSQQQQQIYDVIIVGAGVAGISAARTLRGVGINNFIMLEAMDRHGGRVHGDTTFPVVFDGGAQFLGDVQSGNNPIYYIARQFEANIISSNSISVSMLGGSTVELFATYGVMLAALLAKGEAVRDGLEKDASIMSALKGLEKLPYFNHVLTLLLATDSDDPNLGSIMDVTSFQSHSPGVFVYPKDDTYYVQSGVGPIIDRLASNLPIQLNSPVETIKYGGTADSPIQVLVGGKNKRTLMCKKIIITASIGVLKSGIVEFIPPLPPTHQKVISVLNMGNAMKAAFTFKKNIFVGKNGIKKGQMMSMMDLTQFPVVTLFPNYFGKNMISFIIDGEHSWALDKMNDTALVDFFLGITERWFPGAHSAWTGKWARTNWSGPYTRGATSWATVGNWPQRQQMTIPVNNKIWFAGEAYSISSHSQMLGAYVTGNAAGYGVAGKLGVV
jgi:hypothetical protein